MRSGATGRWRSGICTERRSLSRSNGTRRPLRLITVSSRNCTRSKVVKRKLQARHTRRRRMTEESSVGRESFTWVSRLPQLGQRMALSYPGAAIVWLDPAIHPSGKEDGPPAPARKVTVLCCRRPAQFRTTGTPSPVVDRKPADELLHLLAHRGFGERILLHAFL